MINENDLAHFWALYFQDNVWQIFIFGLQLSLEGIQLNTDLEKKDPFHHT